MNQENEDLASEPTIVDAVKSELSEIDGTDVSEHAQRYEALHTKLQETLSGIDGL
ncbi:hypothetical protein [Candidatus Planktophila limnetica]|uniref:hypothetical protein n=1 Tax=Candidatus Planktophila limnetica TaxID=573600 RepID=UPI00194DBF06|nr:hypothetical protein [Candidatus Planktophila limnetica]